MDHKIIIRTDQGRTDSLREPVQIVFTITPASSEEITQTYDPVAVGHMVFGIDSDQRQDFEWGSRLVFDYYDVQPFQGRSTCKGAGRGINLVPRNSYLVYNRGSGSSSSYEGKMKKPLFQLVNGGTALQRFSLMAVTDSIATPIVAYHDLDPRGIITATVDLVLQVYVVEGEGGYSGDILTSGHLTRPLLDKPIHCNTLPALSTWGLCQNSDGAILLKVNEGPQGVGSLETESVVESVNELRKQLASILTSLDATQTRLKVVETAVTNNHTELSTALSETHNHVARVDQVVPLIQAKVAAFDAFIARTESRAIKIGLGDRYKRGTSDPKIAAEPDKTPGVGIGGVELFRAGTFATNTQDQPPPAAATADAIPGVSAGIAAPGRTQGRDMFELAGDQAPAIIMAESAELRGTAQTPQARAPLKEVPGRVRDSFVLQDSLHILRQQVAGLDRRVPALEAKSEKLARGFGQTRENLLSVHKFLQGTGERVAGLEAEVPTIGEKVECLAETVATTGDYLADLASRLTTVEERGETFAQSLSDIRESRVGSWPSFSPPDNSSARFPSGIVDSSHPSVGASVVESLPWLSLPQALDEEGEEHHVG